MRIGFKVLPHQYFYQDTISRRIANQDMRLSPAGHHPSISWSPGLILGRKYSVLVYDIITDLDKNYNIFQTMRFNYNLIFFKLTDLYKSRDIYTSHHNCLGHMSTEWFL